MSIRRTISFAGLVVLLLTGCASNRELQRVDALRRDPAWPVIRAAAEMGVARHEGDTRWSSSAYYTATAHTNGVWVIVASGAYPFNRLGDHIDILIRDGGEVVSYSPSLAHQPR
ncbi:MAG: hypothetical protein AB1705_08325 [Verrucomicrobiota bacterium]